MKIRRGSTGDEKVQAGIEETHYFGKGIFKVVFKISATALSTLF